MLGVILFEKKMQQILVFLYFQNHVFFFNKALIRKNIFKKNVEVTFLYNSKQNQKVVCTHTQHIEKFLLTPGWKSFGLNF